MARAPSRTRALLAKLALVLCAIYLSSCYFRNQKAFEHRVQTHVTVGMPMQEAITRLAEMRLTCTGANPADCSRIRQGVMPYSCVGRVRLRWEEQTKRVTEVEIPKIICAGL